jgi:HEAT repeat protein
MLTGVDAQAVISALEAPSDDARAAMARLEAQAPAEALAGALATAAQPRTRRLAADLLGRQAGAEGAGALLDALRDGDAGVRAAAADALGKVLLTHGSQAAPEAGPALLRAWDAESSPGVRHMLAAALGAAGHREAIPLLRAAAASGDRGLEHTARWALDRLGG